MGVEYREERYAEERFAVQRPGPCCPLSMTPKLADGIGATSDEKRRGGGRWLTPQLLALLDPLAGSSSCAWFPTQDRAPFSSGTEK